MLNKIFHSGRRSSYFQSKQQTSYVEGYYTKDLHNTRICDTDYRGKCFLLPPITYLKCRKHYTSNDHQLQIFHLKENEKNDITGTEHYIA